LNLNLIQGNSAVAKTNTKTNSKGISEGNCPADSSSRTGDHSSLRAAEHARRRSEHDGGASGSSGAVRCSWVCSPSVPSPPLSET